MSKTILRKRDIEAMAKAIRDTGMPNNIRRELVDRTATYMLLENPLFNYVYFKNIALSGNIE